jgi:hypothetical protein
MQALHVKHFSGFFKITFLEAESSKTPCGHTLIQLQQLLHLSVLCFIVPKDFALTEKKRPKDFIPSLYKICSASDSKPPTIPRRSNPNHIAVKI